MLDNTPNQPTKFRTKDLVEKSEDARGTYNKITQIKYKTSILKSSLCDYSSAYILVSGTITVAAKAGDNPNNVNKEVVFINCAPFTDCISEINKTQIDNAKDVNIVMPMCILIEYSNNNSKTSGSLWQYYRDEPALTDAGAIANFSAADNSALFNFKQKITGKIADGGRKNVEIMVQLIYLSNFWRTLEIVLIICKINLNLTWGEKFVLSSDSKATTFAKTDRKFYVPIVTLSTQDNAKVLQ